MARDWIGHLLGETVAEPAARLKGRVNVYRLVGESGRGLLLDSTAQLDDHVADHDERLGGARGRRAQLPDRARHP